MTVKVYTLDNEGNDVERGTITLKDGALVAIPSDDPFLARIIDHPIMLIDGTVTAGQPEKFLRGLHRQYKSAYLRASEVSE